MSVEEYRRLRTLRAVPVLNEDTIAFLIPELTRQVIVEGQVINTAPMVMGYQYSILKLSENSFLLDKGNYSRTDRLDNKAYIDMLYIRLPHDQFMCSEVSIPFHVSPVGNYKKLYVSHQVTVVLNSTVKSVDGKILRALDPYTAAGLEVKLTIDLNGEINREIGDVLVVATLHAVHVDFPDFESLKDISIQESIEKDLDQLLRKDIFIGYDLDISRTNYFAPLIVQKDTDIRDPMDAAAWLAKKYS